MSTEKDDTTINSENTEQTTKEVNTINSEFLSDKEKPKITKKLSDFEINDLINKNDKLKEEVKTLKSQIVSLNDKINEQIIVINNNKLNYDKESKTIKEKYEKEIKGLKEKLDNTTNETKSIENSYKIKIYEIENEKQLLHMNKQNLENQIKDLNSKITQINKEYESQLKILNDTKKRTITDYEKQIDELKIKLENIQSKSIETESKLKTQEQLVEFAKLDQEEIKIKYENEIKELTNKFNALKKKAENDKKKSSTQ